MKRDEKKSERLNIIDYVYLNFIDITDVKKYEFKETPENKKKIRKKVELNTKKTYFSFGDWDIEYLLDKFKDLKNKLLSVKDIYKKIEEGKLAKTL
jgi:DNA-directed RNA polymerase beta' subunit